MSTRLQPRGNSRHCWYCGKRVWNAENVSMARSVDHLVPKSRGGKTEQGNIVRSCRGCNGDKHNLTLEEYRLIVAFRKGLVSQVSRETLKFFGETDEELKKFKSAEPLVRAAIGLEEAKS